MRKADIRGLVGRKSSGKSYLGLKWARADKHSLAVDLNFQPEFEKNALWLRTKDELLTHAKAFDRRKKQAMLWRGEKGMGPKETLLWAARFCAVVGGVTLFADECESMLPKSGEVDELLWAIIRRNRHIGGPDAKKPLGIPFIWTAVYDVNLNPELRNQSDLVAYFKGTDANYKKRLRDVFDAENVNLLMNGPQYSRLELTHEGQKFIAGPK